MDAMKAIHGLRSCLAFVMLLLASQARAAAPHLRIVISVDDEGTPGFTGTPPRGPHELMPFLKRIDADIHAVIAAAEEEGATEIVVDDSTNTLGLDDIPANVKVVQGIPRPLWMAQAMAGGVDAVICIGAHAGSRTAGAVFAHTMSPVRFFEVRLNGKRTSETALVAAAAAVYNAPLIMVSGDDKIVPEIQKLIDPNIVGVVVKHSLGWQSAELINPTEARKQIVAGVHAALRRYKSGAKTNVFRLQKPITLEMDLTDPLVAEALSYLPMPGLEVLNGTTVKYTSSDYLNIQRVLWFVARINWGYPKARSPGEP